jgi:hypothetical protein
MVVAIANRDVQPDPPKLEFEHRFRCIIDPAGDREAPERPAEVNTTSYLRT